MSLERFTVQWEVMNAYKCGLRARDMGTIRPTGTDEGKGVKMTIEIGQRAPGLRLADENGREVSLPTTAAPTVVIFYRGDW